MNRLLKRIIPAAALAFIISQSAFAAKPGDIIGDVYPTDIKTYFFDEEINSYNIGGKTVVVCEDLNWYFGFDVVWDGEGRTLDITDTSKTKGYILDLENYLQRNISQNVAKRPKDYSQKEMPKHIYFTDIKTRLEGKEIQAYNLNGETAMAVEDLRDFGYDVIWNEAERTLKVYEKFENVPFKTDIGDGFEDGVPSRYYEICARNSANVISVEAAGEKKSLNAFMLNEINYGYAVPLRETLDFLNISYSFENNILTLDTKNAKSGIKFDYDDTSEKHGDAEGKRLSYLYTAGAVVNGEKTDITYSAIVGHFDLMHIEEFGTDIYLVGEKTYIPVEFLMKILGLNN